MTEIVKICQKCGPLTVNQIYKNRHCKKCSKEQANLYAKKNRAKRTAIAKIWKEKNPEKVKSYRDKYNTVNHHIKLVKDRDYGKNYYNNHIEERRKIIGIKKKKEIVDLSNTYVKQKLARKYKMKVKEVPLWMVEIKREVIKIRRKIKEVQESKK